MPPLVRLRLETGARHACVGGVFGVRDADFGDGGAVCVCVRVCVCVHVCGRVWQAASAEHLRNSLARAVARRSSQGPAGKQPAFNTRALMAGVRSQAQSAVVFGASHARYAVQFADALCYGWVDGQQVPHRTRMCRTGDGHVGVPPCRCSYMRKGLQLAYQGLNVVVRLVLGGHGPQFGKYVLQQTVRQVHVMGVLISVLCGCGPFSPSSCCQDGWLTSRILMPRPFCPHASEVRSLRRPSRRGPVLARPCCLALRWSMQCASDPTACMRKPSAAGASPQLW